MVTLLLSDARKNPVVWKRAFLSLNLYNTVIAETHESHEWEERKGMILDVSVLNPTLCADAEVQTEQSLVNPAASTCSNAKAAFS